MKNGLIDLFSASNLYGRKKNSTKAVLLVYVVEQFPKLRNWSEFVVVNSVLLLY